MSPDSQGLFIVLWKEETEASLAVECEDRRGEMAVTALAGLPVPSLLEALRAVPDPRHRRGQRYSQASMLALAVCGMLCDARSLYAIAQWGREREGGAIASGLGFECGRTPCVATLFRTFRDLDVAAFERVLAAWFAAQGLPQTEVLALDGKTLRGIHGEAVPGVHVVAAYAQGTGCVRGQKGGSPKSTN